MVFWSYSDSVVFWSYSDSVVFYLGAILIVWYFSHFFTSVCLNIQFLLTVVFIL